MTERMRTDAILLTDKKTLIKCDLDIVEVGKNRQYVVDPERKVFAENSLTVVSDITLPIAVEEEDFNLN